MIRLLVSLLLLTLVSCTSYEERQQLLHDSYHYKDFTIIRVNFSDPHYDYIARSVDDKELVRNSTYHYVERDMVFEFRKPKYRGRSWHLNKLKKLKNTDGLGIYEDT